jgi:hypothetical protein
MRFIGEQGREGSEQVHAYFAGLNAQYVEPRLVDAFRELRLAEQYDDRP